MKKISILLCSIGMAACTLTGCGKTVPDMTEEENELVTEYAVNVLLKYDKNNNSRLLDLEEYTQAKAEKERLAAAKKAKEEEKAAREEAQKKKKENDKKEGDTEVIDVSAQGETGMTAQTIEEFYGIDGITFQYAGYELTQEYPEVAENEADAFFAMEATPGTQLLVVKFQAINQSGGEKELNMMNYEAKVNIMINQESSKKLLTTMLLNDIRTYQGVLGANEAIELVGIAEVPEGTAVTNLSIEFKNKSGSAAILLQ